MLSMTCLAVSGKELASWPAFLMCSSTIPFSYSASCFSASTSVCFVSNRKATVAFPDAVTTSLPVLPTEANICPVMFFPVAPPK